MQIDDRALNFIQKAKAAGFSQQEVYDELVAKGYEVGAPREEIQEWKAPEPEKSPYSTMDKVKYTLRAAGEAAPFGMGDLVAGYVGAQARNLADYTHGKDLKTRVKGLGKLAFGIISPKDFKEERANFIREQEEFAKHHGGLNFAGEMAGGLLTGGSGAARNVIGKQGIKALMNAGAREGAKFGAAYGAGSALTQDTDKISVPEALKGGLVGGAGGALIGGALPPAIALGAKGAKAGSNLVGRFFGTKKAAGREAQKILEQAGGTGVNEVVNADEGVVALKNAIKSDKGLAKEIEQIADEKLINSADTTKQIISDTLGANDIQAAKDLASAQYRDVLASDPIYVPNNIYKNKGLKKAVKNAIKNDYNDELEKKGINSLYGVQAVKEELDDMIAKSMVIGKKGIAEPTKATARLQEVKAKFLENVDAVAPQYKQVREDFEKAIAPYNILGGLLKDQGRERANTIKAILTNKNKTAISDVFGKEKAESLFDALRKQSRLNENYNALYNAAHTELTKSTPIGNKAPWRESVESLGSIVGTVADMARFGGAKRLRRNIAEILLSGQKSSVKAPVKSIPQESGQSIAGYLGGKLKEKGGYAWGDKPISKLTSEKSSQLKKDLKVLGYKKDVFYNDEIHAPSENALNKIQAYKDIVDGKHFSGSLIDLGETPKKLLDAGIGNNKLYIGFHVIAKGQNKKNVGHDLSKDVLKEVPEKLYNPIAVLDSRSKAGGSVVVTELTDKSGNPVMAAIRLDKTPQGTIINDIKSIHGRDNFQDLFGFSLDEGKLRKIDLKKMENIPSTYRAVIARGSKYSPSNSIVDDKGNVKTNFLKVAGALRHTTNSEGEAIAKRKFGLSNFWDFFKKSKIVDEQGRPLKVFHASDADFDTFDMSKGRINMDIKGAFFSPWELDAKGYGKNVRAFYLNIKNPADEQTAYKALRKYQGQNGAGEKAKQDLIRQGYDGVNNHNEEFIAFYPEQIKSVDNVGTFSPKTGNVYKSLVGGLGISQILKSKENK